jgi:hypothetical protein
MKLVVSLLAVAGLTGCVGYGYPYAGPGVYGEAAAPYYGPVYAPGYYGGTYYGGGYYGGAGYYGGSGYYGRGYDGRSYDGPRTPRAVESRALGGVPRAAVSPGTPNPERTRDRDGDGVPDRFDRDRDGDGVPDRGGSRLGGIPRR